MLKVLVAYATKHQSTQEIAAAIGDQLRAAGLDADVRPVDQVTDLSAYQAVVLGSAVYAGQWQGDAAAFLTGRQAELAARPVWLFSSGPTGEGDPLELLKGWKLPEKLKPVADQIQPRDIAVFHGSIDPQKMNFFERMIIKGVKAPMGDFRDWDAIGEWARGIAQALTAQPGS